MLASWFPQILSWPFPPGVFIAILALLVALETYVNRSREPSRSERAMYSFLALLLVAGEIWMISKDRQAAEKRQTAEDKLQLDGFRTTADGIKSAIAKSDQNFAATMEGITGGSAYAVVLPTITDAYNLGFRIGLGKHSKKNTVYSDRVFILTGPVIHADATKMGGWSRNTPAFSGPIEPDYMQDIPWESKIVIPAAGEVSYSVEVYARNRPTTETLRLKNESKNKRARVFIRDYER